MAAFPGRPGMDFEGCLSVFPLVAGAGVPGLGQHAVHHAIAAGVEDIGSSHYRHLSSFASQEWLIFAEFRVSGLHRPHDASMEVHHDLQACAAGFADEPARTPWPQVSLEAVGIGP